MIQAWSGLTCPVDVGCGTTDDNSCRVRTIEVREDAGHGEDLGIWRVGPRVVPPVLAAVHDANGDGGDGEAAGAHEADDERRVDAAGGVQAGDERSALRRRRLHGEPRIGLSGIHATHTLVLMEKRSGLNGFQ